MSVLEEFGHAASVCLIDRIRVESVEDDRTLTLKDGSLASMIRIDGAMRHEGPPELAGVADALRVSMAPYLSRPGHAIELSFSRDPTNAQRKVEQAVSRGRRRAGELGLDLADILDGSRRRLSQQLTGESFLAVIYTRPSADAVTSAGRRQTVSAERRALNHRTENLGMHGLIARHESLTDALCRDLKARSRAAQVLSAIDALREIRASLYPFTAPWKQEWTPALAQRGDSRAQAPCALGMMPCTEQQMETGDPSNLLPPGMDIQLATEDGAVLDSNTVRIGDALFAGFDVTVAPEILTPFDSLVTAITESPVRLAWRCRFLIEPGGLQAVRLKEQFARLFAFAAPVRNTRIRDAIAALREIDGAGDTVVRLRISFATWARAGQAGELRRSAAILKRAAEQWGNLSADGVTGDPLALALSSAAGLGPVATAPAAAAPLSAALSMLPLSRQASPWREGPVTFRTGDGKRWPYRPGSSRQNSWVEIYSGTPGSGKSVAMHAVNLACVLEPHASESGAAELPRIAILDIGHSSRGFIELLRDALPARRRQEAAHMKLRMTPEHAINPFDTLLGMRRPMAAARSFMVNFLGVLCGAGEREGGCPVAGLASAALDQAYANLSENGSPNRYIPGDEPEVDRALAEAGLRPGEFASWWNVTDALFAEGLSGAAARAQARAVPVLADLVAASQTDHILSLYAQARSGDGGEPVMKAFHRRIAETIRDLRIMAGPTRFNVGPARITALDLAEVAGSHGGTGSLRQTALMYMLARQFMIGNWLADETEIESAVRQGACPPLYEEFLRRHARSSIRIPKLLCIDEYHRTGGLSGFRRQILQDAREGRKNNVRIALASQLPGDFGHEILDVASTILIFDAPSESAAQLFSERFGLSGAELRMLRHQLTGPTEIGAPLFAIMRHKQGTVRQLLYLTLGAPELWALSTTPEDIALREQLLKSLTPPEARAALAARFPGGSAKSEFEKLAARRVEQGVEAEMSGILETLAKDTAARFLARNPQPQ